MKIEYEARRPLGREYIQLGPDIATAILLTLGAGWESAATSSDVTPDAGEVAITERLRDGMRAALKARRFAWSRNMVVLPGTESRSTPDVLLPDGSTDIPIFLIEVFFGSQDHDPHAVVECKRIAEGDRDLCRESTLLRALTDFETGNMAKTMQQASWLVTYFREVLLVLSPGLTRI